MNEELFKTETYVFEHFNKSEQSLLYHNFNHTLRVVKSCDEIAKGENISEQNMQDLKIAAYFHDVAYTISDSGHEEKSAELCAQYLKDYGIDQKRIDKISSIILATKCLKGPEDLLQQIIRDADSSHLIRKDFLKYSDLLRQEKEIFSNESISQESWIKDTLSYINKHRYFTDYAKENWQDLKERTIFRLLKEKVNESNSTKKNPPDRGIETAFRVTLKNHMKLSDIADSKANILLSVNAVIISIALSVLIPKLDNPSNAHLIIPTMILVGFSVISIIFAIFSTMPKVTEGTFTREDIKKRKVNLLFFGNFHKSSLNDYTWAMNELMKDKEYLYNSMIKDLYFLGKVLHKKYRLLTITYTVFIIGILVSVFSFVYMFTVTFVL